MEDQSNKAHKAARSGAKARKKDSVQKERRGVEIQPNRGSNPKAFAGRSALSHKTKKELRSVEKREHTLRLPEDDKTFSQVQDEPPLLVGVVGPPGSGKTTLIRSMVKFYSHRNVRQLRGPVTVVAGRYRRITFMECPNTLEAMCDLSKVVDLILLVIDGNFGFEMETFEFLSIAQVHGFPKVMGIVTHLDSMKTNKSLRRRKNMLRHRFWNEVVAGAKMLTLAPMLHGLYRSNDVMKLHRLLVCVETKPQAWRNTHSCVFADRYEDISNPDDISASNGKCDRSVALYGYVRGHPLKPGQLVHIPGLGDYQIKNLSHQEDPCVPVTHANAKKAGDGGNTKMRHLSMKHKRLYAPYCDVGGVVFDDEAIYLHEDQDRENVERSGKGFEMLKELQRGDGTLDAISEVTPVVRRPATFMDVDGDTIQDVEVKDPRARGDQDSDEDTSSDEGGEGETQRNRFDMADFDHIRRDDEDEDEDDDDDVQENQLANSALAPRAPLAVESTRVSTVHLTQWGEAEEEQDLLHRIKNMFVTGKWAMPDEEGEGGAREQESGEGEGEGAVGGEGGDDTNPYGDKGYESLDDEDEEPADAAAHWARAAAVGGGGEEDDSTPPLATSGYVEHDDEIQGLLEHFIAEDYKKTTGHADLGDELEPERPTDVQDAEFGQELTEEQSEYMKKKMATKKAFDVAYDTDGSKNNTTGFYAHLQQEREEKKKVMDETLASFGEDIEKKIALLGYFSGLYVRIVLEEVPCEFVKNFSPLTPLVVGGLNAGEDRMGLVHMRLKRHRWYPRLLKAQDPVVLSVGWRRIQTQPIFATEDQNGRLRYLKYTPEHMHCVTAFYGPVTPPNAGIICLPSVDPKLMQKNFRVAATGYSISSEGGVSIVKKLKLTGVPQKIQKTTCFVKGMFNSDLEAALFVGAKVKSVSGLRGMVKKVLKGKHGIVRCTFEDKLLRSDIVFIRSWKPVQPPFYCANVQNLLDSNWRGMRPMAQLRRDYNKPLVQNPDSEYKEIKRKTIVEGEDDHVATTRALRMKLPFAEKEEYIPVTELSKQQQEVKAATFVAPEPREVRKKALLTLLKERSDELDAQQDELRRIARRKTQRQEEKDGAIYQQRLKKAKKETARKQEFASQRKSRAHKK